MIAITGHLDCAATCYECPRFGCISALGQKQGDYYANALYLSDFLRRGAATPQKITLLARPVGAPEIFAPVLKRTPALLGF
jgi:hypothetical protein